MMKNAFYFILKSSFRSQDIQVFVITFQSYRKKSFIRKIKLFSQPEQTITIHIFHNISILDNRQSETVETTRQ